MSSKQRVTSAGLAKRLGLSQSTVSRALSGNPRVNVETRNRILAEAKALGYEPNAAARFLKHGRVGTLGLLIDGRWEPTATNWYVNRVLREMALACARAQLNVSIDLAELKADAPITTFHRNRVDGVVVVATRHLDEICRTLEGAALSYILLRRRNPSFNAPYIDTCDDNGMQRALHHLHQLGHSHIAFLGPPAPISDKRVAAFRAGLAKLGLPVRDAWILQHETEMAVVGNLFFEAPTPTAIVCYDDGRAYELIRWCETHGMDVPGDLSVCGFGDEDIAEALTPALTTVHFPIKEMIDEAVRTLIDAVDSGDRPTLQKSVDVHLMERQTTAPPATGYRTNAATRLHNASR